MGDAINWGYLLKFQLTRLKILIIYPTDPTEASCEEGKGVPPAASPLFELLEIIS